MKIAILGCRGIPNNYGGFEQLAEYLSLGLVKKGHDVYVYSSDKHIYKEKEWNGIHILHQFDPEKSIGTIGQFVYDFNCIRDSRRRNFDVILNLGYTSSSIWMKLFPKNTRIITNMDGLEWKRTKYSKNVQSFLMYAEKLAVQGSTHLVADSMAIQTYLRNKYQRESAFIAYGTNVFDNPDEGILSSFKVKPFRYNMLIARMEPENNIEVILDGMHASDSDLPFFVIGNPTNKFGTYLSEKYKHDNRIIFTGPIYKVEIINNLRYFSNLYFHGHSVGGTNPSLLEAMGCRSLIAAHDNEFNRSVLGEHAFYFKSGNDVKSLIQNITRENEQASNFIEANFSKIKKDYSWEKIVSQYEAVMTKA